MINANQLDSYSPYQQIYARWVKCEAGIQPQVNAPYEDVVLPDEPALRDAMLEPYHEALPGQMWIDFFPQMTDNDVTPDESFSVVHFIDAVRLLCDCSTSGSVDWLYQVRYNNGHLYMLVDVPERYLTYLEARDLKLLDQCARSLTTNLYLPRAFCRYRPAVPDSYMLWNTGTNNWQAWWTHPLCPDTNTYKGDLARRNFATPEAKEARAERLRQRSQKARELIAKQTELSRQQQINKARELMQTCHSLLELKEALKIRTTATLTQLGLKAEVDERYRYDRMTDSQLSVVPTEVIREICSHYTDYEKFRRCHPRLFSFMHSTNQLELIYPDSVIKYRPIVHTKQIKCGRKGTFGRKPNYTRHDVLDIADRCTTMYQFRADYTPIYHYAKRQGMLDEVRQRIHSAHPDTYEAHRDEIYAEFKKFHNMQDFYEHADPKAVAFVQTNDNARQALRNYYYKRKQIRKPKNNESDNQNQ